MQLRFFYFEKYEKTKFQYLLRLCFFQKAFAAILV